MAVTRCVQILQSILKSKQSVPLSMEMLWYCSSLSRSILTSKWGCFEVRTLPIRLKQFEAFSTPVLQIPGDWVVQWEARCSHTFFGCHITKEIKKHCILFITKIWNTLNYWNTRIKIFSKNLLYSTIEIQVFVFILFIC